MIPTNTITVEGERASRNFFPHILVLAGGALLFFDSPITKIGGIIALLAGVFAMFARTGLEIDIEKNLYRGFIRLGHFKWGKWKLLPEINYLAIVRVKLSQLTFRPSEATFRQTNDKMEVAYNVNLIFKDRSIKIMRLYTGKLEPAMALTKSLAKKMNLQIYDCTTTQKQWIIP
jgi:hypothetical protein